MVSALRWLNNNLHNGSPDLVNSGRGVYLSANRDDHTLYEIQVTTPVHTRLNTPPYHSDLPHHGSSDPKQPPHQPAPF